MINYELDSAFKHAMRRYTEMVLDQMENVSVERKPGLTVGDIEEMDDAMHITCWGMFMHLGLEEVARLGAPPKVMKREIEGLIEHYKMIKGALDAYDTAENG